MKLPKGSLDSSFTWRSLLEASLVFLSNSYFKIRFWKCWYEIISTPTSWSCNKLAQVDIEWVGSSVGKGKSINTGDSGLNNTRDVLLSKPKFLTRKVLLLYDCDTKKQSEDHENLKIRSIPRQENRKIKKGIENLFPDRPINTSKNLV